VQHCSALAVQPDKCRCLTSILVLRQSWCHHGLHMSISCWYRSTAACLQDSFPDQPTQCKGIIASASAFLPAASSATVNLYSRFGGPEQQYRTDDLAHATISFQGHLGTCRTRSLSSAPSMRLIIKNAPCKTSSPPCVLCACRLPGRSTATVRSLPPTLPCTSL
jgi:hypothetical protein